MPDESSARQTDIVVITVIVVVVVLVAVLIPVGTPRRTSSQNACISNLRMIDSAKEQAALAEKWTDGTYTDDPSNKAIVNMYLKGNTTPTCPAGGVYRYNPLGSNPTCTIKSPTLHRLL